MTAAPPRHPPDPKRAVRGLLLRTLGSTLLMPLRVLGDILGRSRRRAEFEALWRAPGAEVESAPGWSGPPRSLRLFLCCAEASGENHGIHLKQAVDAALAAAGWPAAQWLGLGGPRLAAQGVKTVGDPVARAAMGFGVLRALPFYLDLLERSAKALGDQRPDLVIGVDSPALTGPLAELAQRYGVPSLQFVAPQYWAWAPWRARRWKRVVDLSLTILPFEPAWFRGRGIQVRHVGHPIRDELESETLGPPRNRLVLLPGSRRSVIARNLPVELEVARRLSRQHRELEVVIAQARPELGLQIEAEVERAGAGDLVRIEVGDLHQSLRGARAALSVSGTVLLDLLHQRVPSVVLYRVASRLEEWVGRLALAVPCFGITNLLAGRPVSPEFGFRGAAPLEAITGSLAELLTDGPPRQAALEGLEQAARRLGPGGATERAAGWLLCLATAPAKNPANSRES